MKTRGKKVTMFVLTMILAVGMIGSSVFAANQTVPNPGKTNTDVDGDTAQRMHDSTNVAYITLDKVFEKMGTEWPNQNKFTYEIEKIRFWDNSHNDTDVNGTNMEAKDLPTPRVGETPLTPVGTSNVKYSTDIDPLHLIDPKAAKPTGYDDDTTKASKDVNATKWGEKLINIPFTRPGYYVYKVSEVNDGVAGVTYDDHHYYLAFYVANRTAVAETTGKEAKKDTSKIYYTDEALENQVKASDLASVADDAKLYYIDTKGETKGGKWNGDVDQLYVHTITAWRSQTPDGTNPQEYAQVFENIVIPEYIDPSFESQNHYYIKVKKGSETELSDAQNNSLGKYYSDNDGNRGDELTAEQVNNLPKGTAYWIEVNQEAVDQMVARGEIGKVDRSKDEKPGEGNRVGPNCLEINFWNETDSKDVTLEKKVTGTLGDLNKEFEFIVELTGLQKDTKYEIKPNKTEVKLNSNKVKGLVNGTGNDATKYYVAFGDKDSDGFGSTSTGDKTFNHKFKVILKGGENIQIVGLPKGATYKVTEEKSDHVASYVVSSKGFSYKLAEEDTAASLNEKGFRFVVLEGTGDNQKVKDIRLFKDEDITAARAATGDAKDIVQMVKVAKHKDGNTANGATLATAVESVDAGDGAVTITYTNHRDIETETGIPNFVWPIALAGILALIALAVIRRRKNVATVNDFEF